MPCYQTLPSFAKPLIHLQGVTFTSGPNESSSLLLPAMCSDFIYTAAHHPSGHECLSRTKHLLGYLSYTLYESRLAIRNSRSQLGEVTRTLIRHLSQTDSSIHIMTLCRRVDLTVWQRVHPKSPHFPPLVIRTPRSGKACCDNRAVWFQHRAQD